MLVPVAPALKPVGELPPELEEGALFFTFAVQLWITTVSYQLWRLLAPVAPERARALANGTVRARTSLVLF